MLTLTTSNWLGSSTDGKVNSTELPVETVMFWGILVNAGSPALVMFGRLVCYWKDNIYTLINAWND